jgi:alkanesulfonate monooxygenase SsuD/methylene tetrahydromethanopterin reductase-like flavin-dependent oxidoreductase (luciferase family)
LGVGLGWNNVEYTSLGENFHNRGKRIEEQIQVLRALWTNSLVKFSGKWHDIPDAGINPLPVQRPIPIWMGGHAEPVLKRAASIADGWMPNYRSAQEAALSVDLLEQSLELAGRSFTDFGIEWRLSYGEGKPEVWKRMIQEWQEIGVTHLSFNTMGAGFDSPKKHMDALRLFANVVELASP